MCVNVNKPNSLSFSISPGLSVELSVESNWKFHFTTRSVCARVELETSTPLTVRSGGKYWKYGIFPEGKSKNFFI